ncbi:MAG: DUF3604 domain-containing protein [Thermoleophilia bacterium]|nr:DUF3604 domain-containing protein [Thermoleophilia bacterium]
MEGLNAKARISRVWALRVGRRRFLQLVGVTGLSAVRAFVPAGPGAVPRLLGGPGIGRAAAAPAASLVRSLSVPDAAYSVLWGDLHTHNVYSDDAAEIGTTAGPVEALAYARDAAKLDFVAITDHAEFLSAEEWTGIQKACAEAYQPGVFVVFPGFEYTNSSRDAGCGHKCVIFATDTVTPAPIGFDGENTAVDLWQQLAGYEALTIPHHPAKGHAVALAPMSTDWDYVNASLMPVVEIYSAHGNSEAYGEEEPVQAFRPERSVEAALERWLEDHDPGYKLGILASTDTHLATPGAVEEDASHVVPKLEGDYTGGLVAVLATERTREAVFTALKQKRTYGTSGPRIALSFTASFGRAATIMGGTLETPKGAVPVRLRVTTSGDTAGIDRIRLVKNGQVLTEVEADALDLTDIAQDWAYYRVKVYQQPTPGWDGSMVQERAWSSPVWVEMSTEPAFSDIAGTAYEPAINVLAAEQVIGGYEDGTFRPADPVRRAQFAKMIVGALGLPVSEGAVPCPFVDVEKPADDLYPDDYVAVAAQYGITKGISASAFEPYTPITRAQVITMVVRAVDAVYPGVLQDPPEDWLGVADTSDPTHGANISRAEYNGLLEGLPLQGWDVYSAADRQEVAQVLYNMLVVTLP